MPTALIVIDMQVGSFGTGSKRYDVPGLVARLNALARRVRAHGGTVIFVQHDGPEGDPHHPSQPGWAILPELEKLPADIVVRKTACDSFLGTDLDRVLAARGLRNVVITGCATDYCVDTTVRAALARGYRTIVPTDGHTTADRPHLSAAKIIEHHNAIWCDFIAPSGPATMCPCDDIRL
jgi:nicotinamidase-related amidase